MSHKWIIWIMIILAAIGLADAGYLTWVHLQHGLVNCNFLGGCELVTGSEYGQIGPIPTSALGIAYYGALLTGLLAGLVQNKSWLVLWSARFTLAGFIVSLIFVYIQIVVLRAICIFCMASALASTILFVFGVAYTLLSRRVQIPTQE